MIVPVVFNMEVYGNDYEHLNVFYRYLSVLQKQEKRAIIAHERYFMSVSEAKAIGYTEKAMKPFCDMAECEYPTDTFLQNVGKYMIPRSIEDKIVDPFDCQLSAWISVLQENCLILEDYIGVLFDRIETDYEEKIEAILCLFAPVAFRVAAQKRGIAVIHQEMSMFRPPVYRKTGYFDFKESFGCGELDDRFALFLKEHEKTPLPILNRKEILALFMLPEYFKDIHLIDSRPQYEVGVGLFDFQMGMLMQYGLITSTEILLDAHRRFSVDTVLCRDRYNHKQYDQSPSSYHFITKCKRIAAHRSNLLFEAMLLNRVACVYGASPFKSMGTKGLKDAEDKIATLEFVNFTTFGYFVPWELMTNWEYIRFRLSKPSETEIYMRHLNHYLSCRNISSEILLHPIESRLDELLCAQGVVLSELLKKTDLPQTLQADTLEESASTDSEAYDYLRKAYFNLEDYSRSLQTGYGHLEGEYKSLVLSYEGLETSYKDLQGTYIALETSYKNLQDGYIALESSYNGLQTEYKNLQARIAQLEKSNMQEQGLGAKLKNFIKK